MNSDSLDHIAHAFSPHAHAFSLSPRAFLDDGVRRIYNNNLHSRALVVCFSFSREGKSNTDVEDLPLMPAIPIKNNQEDDGKPSKKDESESEDDEESEKDVSFFEEHKYKILVGVVVVFITCACIYIFSGGSGEPPVPPMDPPVPPMDPVPPVDAARDVSRLADYQRSLLRPTRVSLVPTIPAHQLDTIPVFPVDTIPVFPVDTIPGPTLGEAELLERLERLVEYQSLDYF